MPPPKSAIVLVIDRLPIGLLGPYGCTWVDTPMLNTLAAQSLVLENAITDSPDLDQVYASYLSGRHAVARSHAAHDASASIVADLAAIGATTSLVTDEPRIGGHPLAAGFETQSVLQIPRPTACARKIEETHLAQFFAAAMEAIGEMPASSLLWLHTQGLEAPWDAPLEFRQSLCGEEDPPPPQGVAVPSLQLAENYDPDFLQGMVHACAGQVLLVDECLGVLLDEVDVHPRKQDLLFILTSPRGFPLGEHGIVGGFAAPLHEELLHVPLLVWRGDGAGALVRHHALVQPPDIAATLLDWFGAAAAASRRERTARAAGGLGGQSLLPLAASDDCPAALRDRACAFAADQRVIRTPAWLLRQSLPRSGETGGGARLQLYRKPDDRWEANEVADRCGDIPQQLCAALDDFERAAAGTPLSALPQELLEGIE